MVAGIQVRFSPNTVIVIITWWRTLGAHRIRTTTTRYSNVTVASCERLARYAREYASTVTPTWCGWEAR